MVEGLFYVAVTTILGIILLWMLPYIVMIALALATLIIEAVVIIPYSIIQFFIKGGKK